MSGPERILGDRKMVCNGWEDLQKACLRITGLERGGFGSVGTGLPWASTFLVLLRCR